MINSIENLNFKLKKGIYLVAGATGMIGSNALRILANQDGIKVIAIFNNRKKNIFADNITYVKADLTNEKVCLELAEKVDFILMFAGVKSRISVKSIDPVYPIKKSIEIANNMFYAAYKNKVNKLVWISSSTGYPESNNELQESDMFEGHPPEAWYSVGWMTRYLEAQCKMYSEKFKDPIDVIVLRPPLVYGEFDNFSSQHGSVIAALINRVVCRENPLEIWGDGNQEREVIYALDLALIALKAIKQLTGFHVLNIAEGKTYSINQMLSLMIKVDGFEHANIVHELNKHQPTSQVLLSIKKAKDINLMPSTSLESGLKATMKWHNENR